MMYQKPPAVSWPIWKFALLILCLQLLFGLLVWLDQSLISGDPLTATHIIIGGGPSVFAIWQRWVWKTRTRKKQLLIWVGNVFITLYITLLLLAGAMSKWAFILREENLLINVVLFLGVCVMFLLPWFIPSLSENLHNLQWKISGGLTLGVLSIAGVSGALFGIYSTRYGQYEKVAFVLGTLLSVLAIGFAQHGGYVIWEYRPWAKKKTNDSGDVG